MGWPYGAGCAPAIGGTPVAPTHATPHPRAPYGLQALVGRVARRLAGVGLVGASTLANFAVSKP